MKNFPPTPKQSIEKPEIAFQNRLKKILNLKINPENIKTFIDDALDQLIALIDDVINTYQKTNNLILSKRDLEDKAFEYYNLQGITNLLNRIQKKNEQIADINEYIKNIPQINRLIVPPDKLNSKKIQNGDIPWEQKKLIPRLSTLLYILETDFDIPKDKIDIVEGIVVNEQIRTEPYYRLIIKQLNRLIYICIEEGNVSYLFDLKKLQQNNIDIGLIDILTKQERNQLLEQYPNLGARLQYSKYWRENISSLLASEKLEYKKTFNPKNEKDLDIPQVATGEFDEWRGFYIDADGLHWGTIWSLTKIWGTSYAVINKYYIANLSPDNIKKIKDLRGIIQNVYCYEKLLEIKELQDFLKTPSVAKIDDPKSNQWQGFYTDADGTHWGTIRSLEKILGTSSAVINKYYIANLSPDNIKKIKDLNGIIQNVYCYEKLLENKELQDFLKTPSVAKY